LDKLRATRNICAVVSGEERRPKEENFNGTKAQARENARLLGRKQKKTLIDDKIREKGDC